MICAMDLLKSRDQWVAWKLVAKPGSKKPSKVPINPHTGGPASVADPTTWGSYNQARACAAERGLAGVGYVLTADDDLTGADLDKVRDPATGQLETWAAEIVARAETYIEISPSGTGLRIFWKGKIAKAIKNDKQQVEIYGTGRYLTITGDKHAGCPDEIREAPETKQLLLERAGTGEESTQTPTVQSDFDDTDINSVALRNPDNWVPELFGGKARKTVKGYRVSSSTLGRDLEEDLSITVQGIVDFGVADMGDARRGKRTPVELVMEHAGLNAGEAAAWLKQRLPPSEYGDEITPPFSDYALALRFTEKFADDLRHVALLGRWFRWTGMNWQTDETLAVFDLARTCCREAAAQSNKPRKEIASAKTVAAVERLARADRRHALTVDALDAHPLLLNDRPEDHS